MYRSYALLVYYGSILHCLGGSSRSIQSESPLPSSQTAQTETSKSKPFTPFCNVDQVQLSIHCHINAVKSLLCVPGLVPKDLGKFLLLSILHTYGGPSITCNTSWGSESNTCFYTTRWLDFNIIESDNYVSSCTCACPVHFPTNNSMFVLHLIFVY